MKNPSKPASRTGLVNQASPAAKPRRRSSLAAKGEGSYFRRWKQKYYPLTADVPGVIYYRVQIDRERLRICCHTQDETTARQLIAAHFGGIDLTTEQKFLETVAKAGEKARQKLETNLTKKQPASNRRNKRQ